MAAHNDSRFYFIIPESHRPMCENSLQLILCKKSIIICILIKHVKQYFIDIDMRIIKHVS